MLTQEKPNVRLGTKSGKTAEELAAEKKAADEKAAADKKAAEEKAKAEKEKSEKDKSNEVGLKELQELIGESVRTAIKEVTPEAQHDQITLEGVKTIIAEEFKKLRGDGDKAITKDDVKALVENTIKAQRENLRSEPVDPRDPSDATPGTKARGERMLIEMPYALCKGNLPLHMEQLKNILLHRDLNHGIKESAITTGRRYEDAMWLGIKQFGAKALTTAGDGTGAEFIPRTLSSELYRRMYLESQLAQAFMATEVQMPTDPYDFPLQTTDPTFYINSVENTEADPSDMGTSEFTLTTKTLMALVQYSYKVDEDSIIPILPLLQERLAAAAARALEQAIINGDTTATHQDSDITNAKDVAKSWKGFRKLALVVTALKSDLSTGGLSRANLLALVKLMGKYGVRTKDLLWIVGPKGWNTLQGLDEVVNFYQRGSVGNYVAGGPPPAPWGGSIIVSEQARENLNASGVYDGSTTTKGSILVVNRAGFVLGSRRDFMVEVDRNIRSQTHDIVASFRKAFSPVETPSATIATVAAGYNYNA